MPRRPTLARLLLCALAVGGMCVDAGCSSGPSVSGFGLFNNRNVSVGDTVSISLPFDSAKGESWRLTSYDSVFLMPTGRPLVSQNGEPGKMVYTIQLEARLEGETDVTLTGTSVDSDGRREQRNITYTVRIFPN